MAENFTDNFPVSVNKQVTSFGFPSTFGFTRNRDESDADLSRRASVEGLLTADVYVRFGFNTFFAVVSHDFVHTDVRHVGLVDRQGTGWTFRVNACLLCRFDFIIVEVPEEENDRFDRRSTREKRTRSVLV